jgi:hypothetical protein
LADLFIDWREMTYQPWSSYGETAYNLGQVITILVLLAVMGFIAGLWRGNR